MTAIAGSARPIPARAPFGGLLAAEWIKLRSLRSTWAVLGFGAFVVIGFAVSRSENTVQSWPEFDAVTQHAFAPMGDAFNGLIVSVLMIVAGSMGALSIVGEYANGMIRTTFTAVPDRTRVIAAKVLVLGVVMLVFGVVVSGAAFWSSQAILSGLHIGLSIGDPVVFRAVAATALLVPVSALIGLGIGAIARHIAFAIVGVCAVLVVIPGSYRANSYLWYDHIMNTFPYVCWTRLVSPRNFPPSVPVPTIGLAWSMYVVWPVLAVLVTVLLVRRKDV